MANHPTLPPTRVEHPPTPANKWFPLWHPPCHTGILLIVRFRPTFQRPSNPPSTVQATPISQGPGLSRLFRKTTFNTSERAFLPHPPPLHRTARCKTLALQETPLEVCVEQVLLLRATLVSKQQWPLEAPGLHSPQCGTQTLAVIRTLPLPTQLRRHRYGNR